MSPHTLVPIIQTNKHNRISVFSINTIQHILPHFSSYLVLNMKDDEGELMMNNKNHQNPEAAAQLNSSSVPDECQVVDEDARFNKSLLELKDLRSQLHYAANYCEASFFNTKEKQLVMENTKEYICRALVTVVDHVGNASMKLEGLVSKNEEFTDTANRVSCLQQRLVTCQEYVQRLTAPKLCWTENFRRHHTHYTSLSSRENLDKSSDVVREDDEALHVPETVPKYNIEAEKARPLLIFKYGRQASLTKIPLADINQLKKHIMDSSSVMPLRDPFVISIPRNPSFHFQETKKVGRNDQNRRLLQLPWRKSYKIH